MVMINPNQMKKEKNLTLNRARRCFICVLNIPTTSLRVTLRSGILTPFGARDATSIILWKEEFLKVCKG